MNIKFDNSDTCQKAYNALKWEIQNNRIYQERNIQISLSDAEKLAVKNINTLGYHIIPNFCSAQKCEAIIEEINKLHQDYRNKLYVDNTASDHRLFGVNRISALIDEFSFQKNTFINNITRATYQTDTISSLVMTAHLITKPENLGSGGGWHRDRAESREIKVMLYLNDVSEKNGPYQYYKGTHLPKSILSGVIDLGFNQNQYRYTQKEVERIDQRLLRTIDGKAGTLVLSDARGIHRGMPIKEGQRYALTVYSLDLYKLPDHVEDLSV
ncbi:MAG: hypothetical protein CMJ80_00470 [Planctomycetaceae bacterium]|nr:hypothetical protein [Planctomycetaceae bacterium]